MTRKELLSKAWIKHTERLPPNKEILVYAWNPNAQQPIISNSKILRTQITQLRDNPDTLPNIERSCELTPDLRRISGYFTTHWMPIFPPKD